MNLEHVGLREHNAPATNIRPHVRYKRPIAEDSKHADPDTQAMNPQETPGCSLMHGKPTAPGPSALSVRWR
ncbi:unnamed protein product [Penicillium camemberti]|uniref:Str. FM013 n=1 Tax=Penicillium camemberti (strain FM 013) TaxID=1429867 RepID=A0A0G4NXL5_PENC3|nr:unnamed protein product [Penicillium camemberti]